MTQTTITAGGASDNLAISGGDDGTLLVKVGPTGAKLTALTIASDGTPTFLKAAIGVTDGSNAAAGTVGEIISSSVTVDTPFPATGAYGDLTSITLTAGDWDVTGGYFYKPNGATVTQALFGVGTTAGNSGAGIVAGQNYAELVPTATNGAALPTTRVSITTTTTYYLKYLAVYTVATPQGRGTIRARRVR